MGGGSGWGGWWVGGGMGGGGGRGGGADPLLIGVIFQSHLHVPVFEGQGRRRR